MFFIVSVMPENVGFHLYSRTVINLQRQNKPSDKYSLKKSIFLQDVFRARVLWQDFQEGLLLPRLQVALLLPRGMKKK